MRSLNVISNDFWIDYEYDKKPVTRWLENPQELSKISLEEIKAVFTFIVRQERFNTGFWQNVIKEQYMKHILKNEIFSESE